MNSGLVDLFGDDDDDTRSNDECRKSKKRGGVYANHKTLVGKDDEDDETTKNGHLPPEVERGNIEYKLKLIDPSPVRFEHLVTQMKWRLQEGLGEAIYEIGVSDDGFLKVCALCQLFL